MLTLLKSLQDIDKKIRVVSIQIKDFPKKIQSKIEELKTLENTITNLHTKDKELKKEYDLEDLNLKSIDEEIKKLRKQLFDVKTNEEYKAFLKEIDFREKKKKQIEEKMIKFLEEMENIKDSIKNDENNIKNHIKEKEKEITALKSSLEKLQNEKNEYLTQREKIISEVPKNYISVYEKISNTKDGIAISEIFVENNEAICGECYDRIPFQTYIEIKKEEKLFFCENCGRILVAHH